MSDRRYAKPSPRIDLSTDAHSHPTLPQRLSAVFADYGSAWEHENETVAELEARTAELVGMPRAILCHSGIIANTLAIEAHIDERRKPGETPVIVTSVDSHVYSKENEVITHNTGASYIDLPDHTEKGVAKLLFDQVKLTPACRVATAEITWNRREGAVPDVPNHQAFGQWAHDAGMRTHLDGVRVLDASLALGLPPAEVCKGFDSVIVGFAKCLRAPSGNVLAGNVEAIERVEELMKARGMFLRQGGVVAAQCLFGLKHWKEWLGESHQKTRSLAEKLNAIDGLKVNLDCIPTNIMYLHVVDESIDGAKFMAAMEERGIRADRYKSGTNVYRTCGYSRIVMHGSVTHRYIKEIADAAAELLPKFRTIKSGKREPVAVG